MNGPIAWAVATWALVVAVTSFLLSAFALLLNYFTHRRSDLWLRVSGEWTTWDGRLPPVVAITARNRSSHPVLVVNYGVRTKGTQYDELLDIGFDDDVREAILEELVLPVELPPGTGEHTWYFHAAEDLFEYQRSTVVYVRPTVTLDGHTRPIVSPWYRRVKLRDEPARRAQRAQAKVERGKTIAGNETGSDDE